MDDQSRLLGNHSEVADHGVEEPAVLSDWDRALALSRGPEKLPRRAITWLLVVCAVLGLGGVIGDHFFDGGLGASATPPATTSGNQSPQDQLHGPLAAMMGLKTLSPRAAPGFTLTALDSRKVSLASFRGDVVVLSFFDSRCDDICPVLTGELSLAVKDLGRSASRVVLVTVNTDPLATSTASVSPLVRRVAGSQPRWHFLTGTIQQLNRVWSAYGVTIDVQRSSSLVAHNDVLYFIDPEGRLRLVAVPFADETVHRRYSLPAALESRWASGIAAEARSLLGARS